MPTLESLRRKIDTATDLESVVSTMKTLAAVSIRQYETAVEALADYSRTIEMGFHIVLRNQQYDTESRRLPGKTGAVLFGTDQGMCGQFNEEIVSYLQARHPKTDQGDRWLLLVVGARAESRLRDAGFRIDHSYHLPRSVSDVTNLVQELLPQIESWRAKADVSRLLLFHNRRESASSYKPQRYQLLPIDPERLRTWSEQRWDSRSLPIFRTSQGQLLSRLVRQYLFVSLFRACAESLASENASRIAAMQAAEKNIEERLEELHGLHNQLRQSAITEELLDVVTGFEALAKGRSRLRNES